MKHLFAVGVMLMASSELGSVPQAPPVRQLKLIPQAPPVRAACVEGACRPAASGESTANRGSGGRHFRLFQGRFRLFRGRCG